MRYSVVELEGCLTMGFTMPCPSKCNAVPGFQFGQLARGSEVLRVLVDEELGTDLAGPVEGFLGKSRVFSRVPAALDADARLVCTSDVHRDLGPVLRGGLPGPVLEGSIEELNSSLQVLGPVSKDAIHVGVGQHARGHDQLDWNATVQLGQEFESSRKATDGLVQVRGPISTQSIQVGEAELNHAGASGSVGALCEERVEAVAKKMDSLLDVLGTVSC
mmetsp:Transcript_22316/g.64876  ORF Transcript_22316/g.64876 Transcript_22316/m.64876 type:complete len:218 (-) Transcript_22316:1698-2351(-)